MQTGDLNAEATEKYVDAALAGLSVGARVGQKA
jgi:hypothetical protein